MYVDPKDIANQKYFNLPNVLGEIHQLINLGSENWSRALYPAFILYQFHLPC